MIRLESKPLAAALQNAILVQGGKDVEPSGTWVLVAPDGSALMVTVNRVMGIEQPLQSSGEDREEFEVLPLTVDEMKRLQHLTAGRSATVTVQRIGKPWRWVSSSGAGEDYASKVDKERPKAVYTEPASSQSALVDRWLEFRHITFPRRQHELVLATSVLNVISRLKADRGRVRFAFTDDPTEPVVVKTGAYTAAFATADPGRGE